MTTEEKLKHFLDICVEDARTRSSRMLNEYTAALEKAFEEHQHDAKRRAQMQVNQETEKIQRDLNKQLSMARLEHKRLLGKRQEELKERLFAELKERIAEYQNSPEYSRLLERQIQEAVDFAGGEELVVYLDPKDEKLQEALSSHFSKVQIKLSEYSFFGGTRAVIPGRNILIDHSFQTRLAEAREGFHFDLQMTGKEEEGPAAKAQEFSEGRA